MNTTDQGRLARMCGAKPDMSFGALTLYCVAIN
jgi:hypothetical protein